MIRRQPPKRSLTLTPLGRRALLLDELEIPLPASYSAWGAPDSPYCQNGHPRVTNSYGSDGQGCKACRQIRSPRHA